MVIRSGTSQRWPGITDDEVFAIANRAQAILITADRDFGEIVFRRRLHTHGIITIAIGRFITGT